MAKSSFYTGIAYTPLNPPAPAPAPPGSGNTAAPSSFYKDGTPYNALVNVNNNLVAFAKYYLGAYAVAPTTDVLGNALVVGALYWDTVSRALFSWDGSTWRVIYDRAVTVQITVDGSGSQITPGIKGDQPISFNGSIVQSEVLADQVGSIVFDIWKNTFANFPPVIGNSIVAAAPPTLAAANKSLDTTLAGWNKTINAGDILRFSVNAGVAAVTRAALSLKVIKLG